MYNVHVVLRVDPAETKGMKKSKGIRWVKEGHESVTNHCLNDSYNHCIMDRLSDWIGISD